jgi:cyclohexa-1,5-dienecarbonyl-CoA hydratase
MNSGKVAVELTHQEQVARVTLTAPKANILDCAMMGELRAAFSALHAERALKIVLLSGEGPHFSFGASVAEHLPERIKDTLRQLNLLLWEIVRTPAPTAAAVRGQCLGGAFELALACDFIVCDDTAQFALPEIKLGVFPPAGAALLPLRLGASGAAQMVLTGTSWTGATAAAAGLIFRAIPAPNLETEIDEWLQSEFLPRSPVALRCAAKATRRPIMHALEHELPALEQLYLEELMRHGDPVEGIHAFLEKRQPRWEATNKGCQDT